jgi:hypothetical protein
VLGVQVVLTPADGLVSPTCPSGVSVGTTATGIELVDEVIAAGTDDAEGLTATADEVGVFLVVGAALLTTAASVDFDGMYALSTAEETI